MTLPLWSTHQEVLPHSGTATLIPGFLDASAATQAFDALMSEVVWEAHEIVLFGKKHAEPRLSSWVGDPGVTYTYSRSPRDPHPWATTLAALREACEERSSTTFNSVLANLYRSGNDAMGWHADDEPELGSQPVIASVSLGEERRFDFRHRTTGETTSVHLPHGSLLVMAGETQTNWMHRIARTKKPLGPRINLTYRFVHLDSHAQ